MLDFDISGLAYGNSAELKFLNQLEKRKKEGLFRQTHGLEEGIDFISNDYLSIALHSTGKNSELFKSGSGASRLVCGESEELLALEKTCSQFFNCESALFFQNGYLANLALLSTVASRNDTYVYDAHCHVSLKDGMRLSNARRFSFRHNDPEDLKKKIANGSGQVYVVVESIYSMEGDLAPIETFQQICHETGALLIVDEAHSTGVLGTKGKGAGSLIKTENKPWISVFTFGKALGASGAIIGSSSTVRHYLLNYAHPAIYSTAVSPLAAAVCQKNLQSLMDHPEWVGELQELIEYWNEIAIPGICSQNEGSPVQYLKTKGPRIGKQMEENMRRKGFLTKLMLPPTVPVGSERIRICLHRHNKRHEIQSLLELAGYF